MTILDSLLIQAHVLQDYFVDKTTSEALAGGVITLYKDNQRQTLKNWYYQDGVYPDYTFKALPNPMVLSAAGTIQDVNGNDVIPFFYPYVEDGSNTPETYYITVDSAAGQRQFSRQNFPYLASGEGGLDIPTYQNLIVNGRFWRNITKIGGAPNYTPQPKDLTNETDIVVCPSQHDGFHLPDIRFIKNITGGADSVTFRTFDSGADSFTNAVRPEYYLNHSCTTNLDNDIKYYQIPISLHIKTLDSIKAIASIWAKQETSNTDNKITLQIVQYFGTDSSTPENVLTIGTELSLTDKWTHNTVPFTFPSSTGFTGSATGDDAFYLRILLPEGKDFNLNFAIPAIYLGDIVPTTDFESYDKIDPIINGFRTGDYRQSMNNFEPFGWISANDGSIGAFGSSASNRNNVDTWPLYKLLWDNIDDAWAPLSVNNRVDYTSAQEAFTTNVTMTIPKNLGRALIGAEPKLTFSRTFTVTVTALTFTGTGASDSTLELGTQYPSFNVGDAIQFATTGTLPTGIVAATNYYISNVNFDPNSGTPTISIAPTQTEAVRGISTISLDWTAASGTQTITNTNTDTTLTIGSATDVLLIAGTPVQLTVAGGTLPAGLSPNVIYYITAGGITSTTFKLSSNLTDALAGLADLIFTNTGSGTFTIKTGLGARVGQSYATEVLNHAHLIPSTGEINIPIMDASGPPNDGWGAGTPARTSFPVGDTWGFPKEGANYPGGSNKPTLEQPSLITNVFIKL